MPSIKNRVTMYLDDRELQAFEELREEMGCTNSELVTGLVNLWSRSPAEVAREIDPFKEWEDKIEAIESKVECCLENTRSLAGRCEDSEEWLSAIQHEVDTMNIKLHTIGKE